MKKKRHRSDEFLAKSDVLSLSSLKVGTSGPPPPPEIASLTVTYTEVQCLHLDFEQSLQHPGALNFLVPQTQLFLGHVEGEVVAFAAALYAAFVTGAPARSVSAAAVLQQARVPFQTKAVRAQTRLPHVFGGVASLEARNLRRLRQHLEHGAIHPCNTERGGGRITMQVCMRVKQKRAIAQVMRITLLLN